MNNLVSEYIENLERERKSVNTINSYRYDFVKFLSWLKNKNLITKEDINKINFRVLNEYKLYLLDTLSPVAVNRNLAMLSGFFSYLEDMEIIIGNPMIRVKNCKVRNKERVIPTKKEAKDMLEAVKIKKEYSKNSDFLNIRNKFIINFLLATGLRNSELRNLKLCDIDDTGRITVLGKGDKIRASKMGKSLFEEYKNYLRFREKILIKSEIDTEYIFVSYRGKQLSKQTLIDIVKSVSKEANLDKEYTPHTLRHRTASDLLNETHNVKLVATILGHSSIAVTNRYLHSEAEDIEEALESHQS